jgi:glycosyltransferase involved in cell wall biosynthesis
MRILHLGKYFPPVAGGIERFLGDLVKAQREAGDEAAVLVHGTAQAGDPPWLMTCPVWFRLFFAPISPVYPFWLARAIRTYEPEVLHIHLPNLSAFWALMVPAARKLPWVVHWHADIELSRRSLRIAYPHYHMFERAVLERAERVLVSSPEYLAASAPLRPWRDKCEVVPLGVDPARLPERAARETSSYWRGDGLRLLAVGRLTYYKGFETLIRAVAGNAGFDLVIVGEGEERPEARAAHRRRAGAAPRAPRRRARRRGIDAAHGDLRRLLPPVVRTHRGVRHRAARSHALRQAAPRERHRRQRRAVGGARRPERRERSDRRRAGVARGAGSARQVPR